MALRSIALTVAVAALLTGCVEPSTGTPSPSDLEAFDVEPSTAVEVDEQGFTPDAVEVEANTSIVV
ncbi:MAG: hypothetical protein AAGK32_17275, partial [Actinomycetota bacterium]